MSTTDAALLASGVARHLTPQVPALLRDSEPVPQFALALVLDILDARGRSVASGDPANAAVEFIAGNTGENTEILRSALEEARDSGAPQASSLASQILDFFA